jgi:ABC-2 type transport system ATP-binding protein
LNQPYQNNDISEVSAAIEAQGLSKEYGSNLALNNLWLKIPFGELHGIIGPNGAGKTTALEILSGIIRSSKGFARINGINVYQQPEKAKSNLGYIPEDPVLYRSLTVKEYLDFIREIYAVPKSIWKERMNKYSSLLGLDPYLDEFILTLSKGWIKRVLVCSVMIREPIVYLLDEPFVGLDPLGIHILKNLLKDRCNSGAAVLLTTHSLEIIEKLCDKFTILNNGNTIFQGSLFELQEKFGKKTSLEDLFLNIKGDASE